MSEPQLCYVDGAFAYFTTQSLEDQTGDDWDDVAFEHNAGTPYHPFKRKSAKKLPDGKYDYAQFVEDEEQPDFNPDGSPKWEIFKLAFDSYNLCPPNEGLLNSPYSVDKINQKFTPWLSDRYGSSGVTIFAGCTIPEFVELVERAGGRVYVPADLETLCYLLENK